jgi:hypothetical protein
MTIPKIAKALSNLDDELIAAAAEEKAAPRLLTKKKFVALLAACLLLVGTFAMMGMEEKPAEPTRAEIEEDIQEWIVYMAEKYKESDPEMAAYYERWIGTTFPDPYPAEWQNEDGSMKEFVTIEMLREAYYSSLEYEFIMDNPEMKRGLNASVQISLDENRFVHESAGVVTYHAVYDEEGNLVEEKGEKP